MLDVLLYRDAPNPWGIPAQRPAQALQSTGRPAPWAAMSPADYRALLASTQAAYNVWRAGFKFPEPPSPLGVATSPDGTRWLVSVDNAGAVKARRA